MSRLATLTQDLAGSSYDGTSTFTYSPAHQIASDTQSNDAAYTWTAANSAMGMSHNGLNQLTQIGSTAVSHDTLGNLETGESTFGYGYDVESRLRSALAGSTTVSLAYDPLGLLSDVTTNGTSTKFLYDGRDLVAEYNDSGALLRRYVHGAGMDEPLVWYEGSGMTDRRYLHADERGSIVAISNNSGAGTVSFKYSPDGEATNAASSRFGYTGQVWIAQPGLCYYKSRMYSPKLGRFLQSDAIGYAGGMNLYAYVGGDPINRVDPYGFTEEVLVTAPRINEEVVVTAPSFFDTMDRDLWFLDLIFASYEEDRNRDREEAERPQGEQRPAQQGMQDCMKGKMGALGWAIDGMADLLPGIDNGVGAEEFLSDLTNVVWLEVGAFATYHIGSTAGLDGVQFAERVVGRAFRIGRTMAGGRNLRQLRSAVRTGRSFGRTVPRVAVGVGVFAGSYALTAAAACALE